MRIKDLLKNVKAIENTIIKVGISKQSDVDGKRADILYKNINRGSVAMQRPPRDPIFQPFKETHKKACIEQIKKAIRKNKNLKDEFEKIGKEQKENILNEIKTKGHGKWWKNKQSTIDAKRKSKNPVIRSHSEDIYIAEEKIIKSLTSFLDKKK